MSIPYFKPDSSVTYEHTLDPADRTLWRYISLAKFTDLVFRRALFFVRLSWSGDAFEVSIPKGNLAARADYWPTTYEEAKVQHLRGMMATSNREWTMMNCWHANDVESAAMWSLYAASNAGIAITSSITRLRSVLSPKVVTIAEVKYIDYQSGKVNEFSSMDAALHKRRSFEHEREVRAIIVDKTPTFENGHIEFTTLAPDAGNYVAVNPAQLIEELRVAPEAPE